jgi:hypothetical protein
MIVESVNGDGNPDIIESLKVSEPLKSIEVICVNDRSMTADRETSSLLLHDDERSTFIELAKSFDTAYSFENVKVFDLKFCDAPQCEENVGTDETGYNSVSKK